MRLRLGLIAGLVICAGGSVARAQVMTEAEMRAKVDAAIQNRTIILNNSEDYLNPLYPRPAPPPSSSPSPPPPSSSSSPSPSPPPPSPPPPAAPTSAPVPAFTVRINFEFGSDELLSSAYPQLNSMANIFSAPQYEGLIFLIVGHTDSVGSAAYNQELSVRRADSVVAYLLAKGVPEKRLIGIGRGKNQPLDPAHPESDANRRVEVEVLRPAPVN